MKRLFEEIDLKKYLLWGIAALLIFSSIGFVGSRNEQTEVKGIIVHIGNQYENHFIDREYVIDLLTRDSQLAIVGNEFSNIDLRNLETTLEGESFIKDAQVFRDLQGNIIVNVDQQRPIARLVRSDDADAYVAEDGTILPTSEEFTSRVMLVSGDFVDSILQSGFEGNQLKSYYDLIQRINGDEFWRAQLAQLDIDKNGYINIYPQVTKQVVEFGPAEDIDIKFDKLEIFYKKILPFKGWNTYSRVNLTYLNQIVCE